MRRSEILMNIKATVSGNPQDVSLTLAGDAATVAVDERRYELQVRNFANGEYLLRDGARVYNCRVEQKSADTFAVVLHGRYYEIELTDPKRLRSGQNSGGHHSGAAEIVSPMAGKIVRLLVKPGDQVEAGAGVIVVEAMKMQNEMKAPKSGTVLSIEAEEGATVNAGQVLAVIE